MNYIIVVVLLSVRKSESIARGIRIKNREIEGYLLTPHVTLQNTYKDTPSCGNSRFGYWICTVVAKDKSLT